MLQSSRWVHTWASVANYQTCNDTRSNSVQASKEYAWLFFANPTPWAQ